VQGIARLLHNYSSKIQIRPWPWPFFLVFGGFPCNVFKSEQEVEPSDSLKNRTAQIQFTVGASKQTVNYDWPEVNIFGESFRKDWAYDIVRKPIFQIGIFLKVKR
jgi:hypothetical protein